MSIFDSSFATRHVFPMLALDIQGLTKTYKDGTQALTNINLQVEEGDFFALLGANGAGKTTTIGVLTDLVSKTSGSVKVFGVDIEQDFNLVKSMIGVVPQEFNFDIFSTVENIVIFAGGYYGIPYNEAKKRAEIILKKLELWEKRNSAARELSGGMKRRLMIARALVHQPRLLILDEPTAGVDVQLRRGMLEYLQELHAEGTTIVLTTHYLEEAEQLCKNVAIINKGQVVLSGGIKDILSKVDEETFILEISAFAGTLKAAGIKQIDETTLEVTLKKTESINQLIKKLDTEKVQVKAIKPKGNRLEELFVKTIQ
jgi:ABC-2 type transport system ATP-binding protein